MAIGIDDLDEQQVRTAAKLLERENERLLRQVLALKKRLSIAEGGSATDKQLLLELEQQLAVRNKMIFGRSSERRGKGKEATEKTPQTGHGPREQTELAQLERVHELDDADRVCTSCGGALSEMSGQFEESEEVDTLERQFVLVRHKRKKYRCACGEVAITSVGKPGR